MALYTRTQHTHNTIMYEGSALLLDFSKIKWIRNLCAWLVARIPEFVYSNSNLRIRRTRLMRDIHLDGRYYLRRSRLQYDLMVLL